ncbi:MAG: hypothetical protein HC850_01890 [Rhodomicrobium sp.]|nr:hypothetical protein [Rhodomicrobium sp.]
MCLDRHHSSPTELNIEAPAQTRPAIVQWEPADQQTKSAWNNNTDATEDGACCVALAAVELLEGMVAVRRAENGTGADYYIAPANVQVDDLENLLRLEISGIDRATHALVSKRLRQKVAQAERGKSNLPAIAAVVGFSCSCVSIKLVE